MLVLVEFDGDGVAPLSAAALATAHGIVRSQLDESVEAVAFPGVAHDTAATLSRHGVVRVHRIEHAMLADYSPECWGESLGQLVRRLTPTALIAPGTARGNEVLAQTAARADLPLATNCRSIVPPPAQPDGSAGSWQLSRVRQGGMLVEDAELTAPIALMTVAPSTGADEDADVGVPAAGNDALPHSAVPVTTFTPDLGPGFVHSRLVDRTTETAGVSLASARVVVSGGRGVGGADGFVPLEELAKLTGGAVGCSRVATNNGWRPHRDQVGQTGTKVNPELYIACGISGATQHWVGCMGAKHILAVNTDSSAPLVTRATHAVIGDVAEVIPAVVDEIHRRARRP